MDSWDSDTGMPQNSQRTERGTASPMRRHQQQPPFVSPHPSNPSSYYLPHDEQEEDRRGPQYPTIYSVPTTETFGDESLLLARPYHRPSPAHVQALQTPPRHARSTTDRIRSAPAKVHGRSSVMGTPARMGHSSMARSAVKQHVRPATSQKKPIRRRKKQNDKPRDFQHDEDMIRVSVQAVNIAQRSAFECQPAPSIEDWQTIAQRGAALRAAGHGNPQGAIAHMAKRMSPSLQHLEVLHILQRMSTVRQVQFSPSTALESDPFVGWDDLNEDGDMEAGAKGSKRKRRDGRYRPIDPVKATVAVLPQTAPLLSNRKVRLPMRSDVGFPNASPEEIQRKQKEIAHETEWEEASPRLVVLVTSDDLGKAVQEDSQYENVMNASGHGRKSQRRKRIPEHMDWNGGGLPGIPFAGRELIRAKQQNIRHFGHTGPISPALEQFARPNPYSVLAPPLDAGYSPSKGWRPRPFHDRPARMKYCLVCPADVSFGVGDIEPLVCSLTLYSLPVTESTSTKGIPKGTAYGKISEEFWFPAGDWKRKIHLQAAQKEDGTIDQSMLSSWLERKSKALFSFDPLSLHGGLQSVFVVLQVYRLAHGASSEVYQESRGTTGQSDAVDRVTAASNRIFQQFGTQLLTPVCFGLSSVFGESNSQLQWPEGSSRNMKMFPFPCTAESHDSFILRLAKLARDDPHLTGVHIGESRDQNGVADDKSTVSEGAVSVAASSSSESSKKKRGMGRLFSKMGAKTISAAIPVHEEKEQIIDGQAKMFISSLSMDFLQVLLSDPESGKAGIPSQRLPRLVVDVSGDLAVLLDPTKSHSSSKRSSLLRLPPAIQPAGYVGASEFREVHFLPARKDKHYDVDFGLSSRSLFNLLFLYPRSLRLSGGSTEILQSQFTVRMRMIQTSAASDEESGRLSSVEHTVTAFHSRSPWTGSPLADEIFTKTFEGSKESLETSSGVPIRDEIKLRLPAVLDGSYSLHFALFCVESTDDTSLRPVAEALIPISSSVPRDQTSGSRVTTIIPNGNHRLKVGDFQLQLETRLVSAVHVGDPSVASTLRDFPYARERGGGLLGENSILRSDSNGSGSSSGFEFPEIFPRTLVDASPSTVTGHFEVLLYMHLCNLVNLKENSVREGRKATPFMIWSMNSLFEVFRKVRVKFESATGVSQREQLRIFFKNYVDLFDEKCLSPSWKPGEGMGSTEEADSMSEVDPTASQEDLATEDDPRDETHDGAIRIISRPERRSRNLERRLSSVLSELGPSAIPFSRVAYGASKLDLMRIEAELDSEQHQLASFFDDDETIATSPTVRPAIDPRAADEGMEKQKLRGLARNEDGSVDGSIVRSEGRRSPEADHTQPSGGVEFAQRVRTAAQIILAPCVGPTFTSILTKSNGSDAKENDRTSLEDKLKRHSTRMEGDLRALCMNGSDSEDDFVDQQSTIDVSQANSGESMFRGPQDGPLLIFSVASKTEHEVPVACGEYMYESIMLLWLKSWLDHVEALLKQPRDTSGFSGRQFVTFVVPEYDLAATAPGSIFSFYANMDILLPLCLKSIVLRYTVEVIPLNDATTRAMLDEGHMLVLEPFVEMLARGLIGQSLAGLGSQESRDRSLLRALSSSEVVLDFLVGLLGVIHAEHIHCLCTKFFKTLRDCETEQLGDAFTASDFTWTEENLHRVRSSRQLRLKAIESLSVLPCFVALNYPPKYSSIPRRKKTAPPTWVKQMFEQNSTPSSRISNEGFDRLPPPRWLSDLVIGEALSICSLSCEAVVAEAMAHIEVSSNEGKSAVVPSLKKRPGASLKRDDLLMLQSLAIHAITCVYELILRRHVLDKRFQTNSCRERIAGLFTLPILDKSISSARWLARMESTHKVRSLWLLTFVYILQEAPDSLIRDYIQSLCSSEDVRVHRFIRLLRMCSSTFQGFVDLPRHAMFPSEVDKGMSPWLLQESFNTICAATNIVVEECVSRTRDRPKEQEKIMVGILDLLLHLLTTPQSSVTHLRAVGGALQALESFGIEMFLAITGDDLQHWIRVMLSLMNSVSLSVRSIAVDFMVSLVGSTFDLNGSIDSVSLILASVLPEVVARELALHSVSGHVSTAEDIARAIWPLRRSLADLEDSNPLDDDRIDIQLSPILTVFCRTCQAIIDGVLLEIRLQGEHASIVGVHITPQHHSDLIFDADEESLFEAASFFQSEIAPLQKLRWLLTLKRLHESKGQWVEAAEALFTCAQTICESMPHLKHVWRPSRFVLWSDSRRSLWLETVGFEVGLPDRGNTQVMDFADDFLEPPVLLGTSWKDSVTGKLQQPSVPLMSSMLGEVTKEAVELYMKEENMDELANIRLESLLKSVISVLDAQSSNIIHGGIRLLGRAVRKKMLEDEAALRKVLANISGHMTRLAERLVLIVQDEPATPTGAVSHNQRLPKFVVVHISGHRPQRFLESTTLPPFLEFDAPCIYRLPCAYRHGDKGTIDARHSSPNDLCLRFAEPLLSSLRNDYRANSVVLSTVPKFGPTEDGVTYLHVFPIESVSTVDLRTTAASLPLSKSFYYQKTKVGTTGMDSVVLVEMKVANVFPCALSRQRVLITSEIESKTQAMRSGFD